MLAVGIWIFSSPAAESPFALSWTNNFLTISNAHFPGGKLDIWYLEAFCRKNSTHQDWGKTKIPHRTRLTSGSRKRLEFETKVEPDVLVVHSVTAEPDTVEFVYSFSNQSTQAVDLEWFQPACIRVDGFTGLDQTNYSSRCFIFTEGGLTTLDKVRRRTEALYHGGQVYVPDRVNLDDVNPRPICEDQPTNGLIGCFSANGKYLLATASNPTHELFQGVYACIHNDPHIGGLGPNGSLSRTARLYFMPNDPQALVKRYQKDFANSLTNLPDTYPKF